MHNQPMFSGQLAFLSNFYPVYPNGVEVRGLKFPTVEHAYQYAKSDPNDLSFDTKSKQSAILACSPFHANKTKRLGFSFKLRPDWEAIKLELMLFLLSQKFADPFMKKCLDSTKGIHLVETNYWHDNFWGNCLCPKCEGIPGQNMLGQLLMEIRDDRRTDC